VRGSTVQRAGSASNAIGVALEALTGAIPMRMSTSPAIVILSEPRNLSRWSRATTDRFVAREVDGFMESLPAACCLPPATW
jgi:hypothetical protein